MQVTAPSHSSNVTSANILPVVFEFFVHPKSIFRPCQTAINSPSYVSRILRLTLLAPAIVVSILDGRQPADLTLAVLMRPFAVGWREPTLDFLGHSHSNPATLLLIGTGLERRSA
jgi:hypothetical protein